MEARAQALHEHFLTTPTEAIQNNPWAVVNAIETYASTNHMMIFKGGKLIAARDRVSAMQPAPKKFVEFGTFVGCSAIAWGAILRDLHGDNLAGCNVYTFELDPKMAVIARDMIKIAGLEGIVHVLEGPGSESLRKLHREGKLVEKVDVAFFDHWEEYYLPDLQLLEELDLLKVGSKMVADNTDFPGAPKYLEYVKAGGSEKVRYESESIKTEAQHGPSIVEISDVVRVA
ncbi:hypothetical protein ASPWEDRAFT_667243 [Aspergillus wentii DTO 134E9]|uniref:catechol O-methyltransferase n=1 Tax=Aspergillus wentii DTO 134E9 TaxID=1073089 RepID=A0A1L9RC27_ASPWE|nr:uncharacterized protein ASPWEDRAFT_667243 [Aspergillus wentii DTO 134E9]OJJ32470.1 hypothetical protein ASPWEDRAFT_667243 [Aspergillus wentii DTO 134E9]